MDEPRDKRDARGDLCFRLLALVDAYAPEKLGSAQRTHLAVAINRAIAAPLSRAPLLPTLDRMDVTIDHNTLCANCGCRYGEHYGMRCGIEATTFAAPAQPAPEPAADVPELLKALTTLVRHAADPAHYGSVDIDDIDAALRAIAKATGSAA